MKSIISRLGITASLLSSLFLHSSPVFAKKDGPEIKATTLDNGLNSIFYFDDSDVILGLDVDAGTVHRSDDAGETWKKIDDDGQAGKSWDVWPHPWDNQRAYILGETTKNWITTDRGKTWKAFTMSSIPSFFGAEPFKFHGRDAKKVIWNGADDSYYTEDDFETTHRLATDAKGCQWAVGTPQFGEDIASKVDDRIFCITEGLYSDWRKDYRLVMSDDFFDREEIEPALDNGRAVTGIISMAAVKKYIVAAAKSEGTDELALYVTDDGSHWHRAEFGQHRIAEDAYTILESTNYSMQVDVLGSRPLLQMGHLFTSNSNGTYFTRNIDYTNRDLRGRVDFEKVQNIQGIVLVNVVDNHEEVERTILAEKKIVSKISFDDGRSFDVPQTDGEDLHLHSVTDAVQGGRMFSSPAPGIVMGVGNTGKYLKAYEDGDLYVSDDAGRSWTKALTGAHMYEFGNNGAVLVAVDDEAPTDQIQYSLDHGQSWEKADLGEKVRVRYLTTAPDSTTLKFLMMGVSGSGSKMKSTIFKIDFDGLHERTCSDKDFERWAARTDTKGNPTCLMGHKQFFRRRKADAKCFIDAEFKDPEPEFEPCPCTEADFECDFNFERSEDRKECNPVTPIKISPGQCKDPKDKFTGPSGWRLIPGNECERKNGVNLDKEIERPCSDTTKKPISGEIEVELTPFKAKQFREWYYLDRADTDRKADDETIIMRTSEREIFLSRDHGKKWAPILEDESIAAIIPNPYNHNVVYFLTGGKKVWYTVDRGDNFDWFNAPKMPSPNSRPTLKFHPEFRDWLLWAGLEDEHRGEHTNVYYSKDRGNKWDVLARFAQKCEFIHRQEKDQLIYCEQYQDEDPDKNLQLVSSENFFASQEVHFSNILDFATMAEFIIVAAKADDQQGLKVDASVDGRTFAQAKFPKNFHVDHQQAYTVLDSSTHAVFLHVTVNPYEDQEYGTIIKSNSNGTSYVLTLNAVNRDALGYVDFEKMQGLEGVAMVNIVANDKEADNGAVKKLKSKITHNDGAEWALIPPPKKDALNQDYSCVQSNNKATEDCSLHLHSYTERTDKSATFSSPSAVGLMMAVGNVGEFLDRKDGDSTDTFITRDAGITWNSVKKGSYMWEYGDQGSVIVIVPEAVATRIIFYTLDEGQTWKEFEFSKADMIIDAITTLPSDNSLNFLLWGRESSARGTVTTVNLDFSGLKERSRQCDLDEEQPVNDDYELWSPKHPMQDNDCLFGHKAEYHRKKTNADCFNGKRIDHLHTVTQNCTCTRQDFECSYNFQIQSDNTCDLVEGLAPIDAEQYCKDNPDAVEFWKETGYRKIPISTCDGGTRYDQIESVPCKGHEDDYNRKHGISGAGLFFAITIPIIAAIGVGYWVWKRYQEYGLGGFGQIRLGDSFGASTSASRGQSPFISIPVAIVAGVWAVVKAVPLLASSLFRSAKGYVPVGGGSNGYSAAGPYRSRDAFSRPQDYSNAAFVEDDELLGDEEEAEGEEV